MLIGVVGYEAVLLHFFNETRNEIDDEKKNYNFESKTKMIYIHIIKSS